MVTLRSISNSSTLSGSLCQPQNRQHHWYKYKYVISSQYFSIHITSLTAIFLSESSSMSILHFNQNYSESCAYLVSTTLHTVTQHRQKHIFHDSRLLSNSQTFPGFSKPLQASTENYYCCWLKWFFILFMVNHHLSYYYSHKKHYCNSFCSLWDQNTVDSDLSLFLADLQNLGKTARKFSLCKAQ